MNLIFVKVIFLVGYEEDFEGVVIYELLFINMLVFEKFFCCDFVWLFIWGSKGDLGKIEFFFGEVVIDFIMVMVVIVFWEVLL